MKQYFRVFHFPLFLLVKNLILGKNFMIQNSSRGQNNHYYPVKLANWNKNEYYITLRREISRLKFQPLTAWVL